MKFCYGFGFNKFKQISNENVVSIHQPTRLKFEFDETFGIWSSKEMAKNESIHELNHIEITWNKIYTLMKRLCLNETIDNSGNSKKEETLFSNEKKVNLDCFIVFNNSMISYSIKNKRNLNLVKNLSDQIGKKDVLICPYIFSKSLDGIEQNEKISSFSCQQFDSVLYALLDSMEVYKLLLQNKNKKDENIFVFKHLTFNFFSNNMKIKLISCGHHHTLFLSTLGIPTLQFILFFSSLLYFFQGQVWSSGIGNQGQLGHGNAESSHEPKIIEALLGIRIVKIAAGGWHSIAISDEGDVFVWGWNNYGQLGLKTEDGSIEKTNENNFLISDSIPDKNLEPIQIQFVPTVLEITTYKNNNSLMDSKDLSDNIESPFKIPKTLESLHEFHENVSIVDICCGSRHTLALSQDNKVYAWGWNKYGQLGVKQNGKIIQGEIEFYSLIICSIFISLKNNFRFSS